MGSRVKPVPDPLSPATENAAEHAAQGSEVEPELGPPTLREWRTPIVLFLVTCVSTLWVGAQMEGIAEPSLGTLWRGWTFAVPLMAILVSHEMGHYIAGRIHRVDTSPPYFIPMPLSLLGTMGAVIRMRGRIRSRDALLDIGASGPLAGMVVALPVLLYGLHQSPVEAMTMSGAYIMEGHSLLYEAALYALKGPIPAGHDIMLSPCALAGWAGLLVTMINMIPFGQLDGGHVSYALFGRRQDQLSAKMIWLLAGLALVVSLAYGVPSMMAGDPAYIQEGNFYAGVPWLVWAGMLLLMRRYGGSEHPPTDDEVLSPKRRVVAAGTLVLFVLLFMPSMVRSFVPSGEGSEGSSTSSESAFLETGLDQGAHTRLALPGLPARVPAREPTGGAEVGASEGALDGA